jgi:hypothetical protein
MGELERDGLLRARPLLSCLEYLGALAAMIFIAAVVIGTATPLVGVQRKYQEDGVGGDHRGDRRIRELSDSATSGGTVRAAASWIVEWNGEIYGGEARAALPRESSNGIGHRFILASHRSGGNRGSTNLRSIASC